MQVVLPSISLLRRFSGGSRSRFERRELGMRTAFGFLAGGDTIVRCLKGRIWITDGRTGDLLVSAGGKFVGEKGARIVIEALEDSLMEIHG